MAVVKIEEVYLYTSEASENAAENIQAKAFMDHGTIPFVNLFYNDQTQLEEVLSAVNTWWERPDVALPPLTEFPFITYTEVHDDIPARHSPVKYLAGIDAIKTFPDLYNSVMNK
jgi:hypothetical protein